MECDAGIADGRTPGAVLAEKLFGLGEKGTPSMRANVKVGDLTLPYRWVDIDHPGSFSTDSTNSVFTGDVKLTLDMRPSEVTVVHRSQIDSDSAAGQSSTCRFIQPGNFGSIPVINTALSPAFADFWKRNDTRQCR